MQVLTRHWWAFVIRGILAVLFGVLTLLVPGMALLTFVFMFGFYAIAEGVFNIVGAFRRSDQPQQQHWWALLLEGLLSIVAGMVALFFPSITAWVLLFIVAGWAIATGVLKIAAAIELRKLIKGEWVLGLSGILSILLGLVLAAFPPLGIIVMSLWIGVYVSMFGALLIGLGLELRKLLRESAVPPQEYRGVAPGH